ncbi:hypothetical protein MMC26_005333 [Xylographa opegraphella]|nr:hypothetical protein [Xylographa opegraphella]
MSTTQSPKATQVRRTRKSIAYLPSPDVTLDKENTEDGATTNRASAKPASRKVRSRSLGPGGLDALKQDPGNRQKLLPVVRSILKPTIPLSPPKQIPPHPNSRKSSPAKSRTGFSPKKSPRKSPQKGDVKETPRSSEALRQSGVETLPNPFNEVSNQATDNELSQETRIALRTEEEQQAAVKERERKELIERRDARRKSLANRRVSFAPEATLHTWDVVELAEDATTSSEATNSTRRASNGSTLTASPFPQTPKSDTDENPSTPTEQIEEIQVAASPDDQRKAHQKKRRRSSGIPPMNFNNPDDFSSSPEGSIVSEDSENQTFTTADADIDSSDSDDKDLIEGEDTVTGVDQDDTTNHSVASVQSSGNSSTSSSGRLENSLRQAAAQAGTQGIEYDEHGDLSMEMAEDEITNAFKYVAIQKERDNGAHLLPVGDQENINPFPPAFKANLKALDSVPNAEEEEQTMDFTVAAGAILTGKQPSQPSPKRARRNSVATNRRRSNVRRRSSGASSILADETMDLTTAIGGIQQVHPPHEEESLIEDEDLTMEFTSAIGSIMDRNIQNTSLQDDTVRDDRLAEQQLLSEEQRRMSISSVISDEDMDMTTAVGGILSSITERTEPSETDTHEMDITTAIGAILPDDLKTDDKTVAKQLMEQETDHGQLTKSAFERQTSQELLITTPVPQSAAATHLATAISDTGSPSLITANTRSGRRSGVTRVSTTPKTNSRVSTPVKQPSTPSKQLTPQPPRPTTPGKTPLSKNVAMRTSSPKRLFRAEIKKAAASTPTSVVPALKFDENATTGTTTPSVVLKPRSRRVSGLGIDKEGLGSPRVAVLLDGRGSIGENALTFTPQGKTAAGVRFEDPRAMQEQLENERIVEQRRESGRGIMQQEADAQNEDEEKDATANLRDMIESLTPKKNKLRGRKSLHVGAATGLLGKRPAELDEDEDDDPSPKRLMGYNRSPVKSIKLPAPPSKSETTGRLMKGPRFSLGQVSGNAPLQTPTAQTSADEGENVTTPRNHGRYKDTELVLSTAKPPISFHEKIAGTTIAEIEPTNAEDRIQLQDFLNMTSIRFMELTTTKRRHTLAPANGNEDNDSTTRIHGDANDGEYNARELESCVVAGACTVPMLELYQHGKSCRELKKYISEGRSIVREIEADTYEENPALFREYISAAPEIKSIMDNQFKNVKTHARLLSKAMWYEWRMKLLDGLKDGLVRISQDLNSDAVLLGQQERLLEEVVPTLNDEHERLSAEAQTLQAQADEMADCDQEELADARDNLVYLDEELDAKRRAVTELQQQLMEQEKRVEDAIERKQEYLGEIREAERVKGECRGWSSSEVAMLKANVDALEHAHGWTIASVAGSSITLTYRSTLQLFLTPSSFYVNKAAVSNMSKDNSSISLTYIADTQPNHPKPLSTENRFFLQIMRARLQCLRQCETPIKDVLAFVSSTWDHACRVSDEVRALNLTYITTPEIQSDDILAVKASILLREMKTKVGIVFKVDVGGEGLGIAVDFTTQAKVVYGEDLHESKMGDFLRQKVARDGMGWVKALRELEARLVARRKRERVE